MLSSLLITLAYVITGMTSAIPSINQPQLPEGFFFGTNNADGTTTLDFPHLNETFIFNGKQAPTVPRDGGTVMEKRAGSDCWKSQSLSHSGVDNGIREFRNLFNSKPYARGYLGGRWNIPYFGYNSDGVYVYFCYNINNLNFDDFEVADLDDASYRMDQDCGAYVAGYYQWDSPSLFGKCLSGTAVCLGSR